MKASWMDPLRTPLKQWDLLSKKWSDPLPQTLSLDRTSWVRQVVATVTQTLQKLFGFYQTEEGFWTDFADLKHDYTKVLPVLLIFYQ